MIDTKAVANSSSTAVEAPGAATQPVAPAQIVEQLRAVRATITEIAVLTPAQKRKVANKLKFVGTDVQQAQINAIGSTEVLSDAVGVSMEEVQIMADDTNRWTLVEDELRGMLAGVEGANLLRRQQLEAITSRSTGLATQFARDPKYSAAVLPHVLEIRRLKRLARGKKAATAPQTPSPAQAEADKSGT
jgi:hypothetical protein